MIKSATRIVLFVLLGSSVTFAQTGFFKAWEERVRATSARQPAWPVPVVAPSSVIVQLARVDFLHQYTSTHTETWNYDNGKGVNLIPFARTEFDINLPPYIQHNAPRVKDGAGDVSFVAKYRMFAANEGGNYSTAVQVAFSVPTGSYKNGTAASTIHSDGGCRKGLRQIRYSIRNWRRSTDEFRVGNWANDFMEHGCPIQSG